MPPKVAAGLGRKGAPTKASSRKGKAQADAPLQKGARDDAPVQKGGDAGSGEDDFPEFPAPAGRRGESAAPKRASAVAAPAPVPSASVDEGVVATFLKALESSGIEPSGQKSLEEWAKEFANLRTARNAPFITSASKYMIVQIVGMAQCIGLEETYDYFTTALRNSVPRQKILLQAPSMKAAQSNQARRIDNLTREGQLKVGLYRCGKCGSKETRSTQKMTRSADEPMTNFITCMACGNHWRD